MREQIHGALHQEVTRKQFLQYLGTALLMVFGLNNLISLLTGNRPDHFLPGQDTSESRHGFGSSKFGV
jgi:hypothetical protein